MRHSIYIILLAGLCPSSAQAQTERCTRFNSYKHDDQISSGTRVGYFWIYSAQNTPIRIYDPATDRGPTGATGAMMQPMLRFNSGDDFFRSATVTLISFNPAITNAKALRGSKIVRRLTFPGKPQSVIMSRTLKGFYGNEVRLENSSKESVVVSICVNK